MKRFHFKLEKLLEIKKDIEFKAKLKFAQVLQKKINIEMENADMRKNIYQAINNDNSYINIQNVYDYNSIELNAKYINNLENKIKQNEIKKHVIELELEKLKDELLEATRERKKIEQLEKKQFDKYKEEMKKEDVKRIDDMAGRFFERNRKLKQ